MGVYPLGSTRRLPVAPLWLIGAMYARARHILFAVSRSSHLDESVIDVAVISTPHLLQMCGDPCHLLVCEASA